jgi:hypothetical protein
MQIIGWFGDVPDFIITIDAEYAMSCSDAEFCALIEHELYHAAQETDPFGAPKFRKSTGLPVFTLRGHDIEEFIGQGNTRRAHGKNSWLPAMEIYSRNGAVW